MSTTLMVMNENGGGWIWMLLRWQKSKESPCEYEDGDESEERGNRGLEQRIKGNLTIRILLSLLKLVLCRLTLVQCYNEGYITE